jgi:hypothetical protein
MPMPEFETNGHESRCPRRAPVAAAVGADRAVVPGPAFGADGCVLLRRRRR